MIRYTDAWQTIKRNSNWLWIVLFVFIVRIVYCFSTPLYTTDVLRNIGYGNEFWHYGLRVYEMTPFDFTPEIYQFFWQNHYYTYPVVTLLFFALTAKIWAAVFFVKLVLTILDGINTLLIYRITRDRWVSLLYACHPIGIWFASHEGQFEPFVNFITLLAVHALRNNRPKSFFFLALAVQTKLFPVFLAPYFLLVMWRHDPKKIPLCLAWGAAGLLSSLFAALRCDYLIKLFAPGYVPKLNPVSWALFDEGMHGFNPFPLVLSHWIAGLLFVLLCLWFIKRENRFLPYLAPLVFVAFVKANPMGQFWYFLLTPVFCLTVENQTHRRILVAATWLFGIRSLYSILIGPIGYLNPDNAIDILRMAMYGV